LEPDVVPPELSGVLELFTPQVADSGRQRRLQFLEDLTETASVADRTRVAPAHAQLVRFYTEAAPGFALWSPAQHLHFGYQSHFAAAFDRKAMLDEMTRQVIARLQLDPTQPATLLDLGCGSGASAVQVALQHPRFAVDGISLVPAQVERACELAARSGMARRLRFWIDDFTASRGESASYDGLYAIESACHDRGLAKEDFVREAARLLKGGRRLALADGFYKGTPARRGLLGRIGAALERHWGLETFGEIGAFTAALRIHGFTEVKVEEISGRVAASALHGPLLAGRCLLAGLAGKREAAQVPAGVLQAGLLAPLLGLAQRHFGYFLVSARRRRV
jgi:SAM-dependent methyltransferase